MTVISVKIKAEIEEPLEQLSVNLDRSKDYLINLAIKEFLKRQAMEETQWLETLEALDSVRSGKEIDENIVNSWLESWGTDKEKAAPYI